MSEISKRDGIMATALRQQIESKLDEFTLNFAMAVNGLLDAARADEREACATLCDTVEASGEPNDDDWREASRTCAEVIRARGKEAAE